MPRRAPLAYTPPAFFALRTLEMFDGSCTVGRVDDDGLVSILIIFMGFIVWDLAKKSKAGRFGSFILFFVLGLGVAAFIIKSVVIGLIESGTL